MGPISSSRSGQATSSAMPTSESTESNQSTSYNCNRPHPTQLNVTQHMCPQAQTRDFGGVRWPLGLLASVGAVLQAMH